MISGVLLAATILVGNKLCTNHGTHGESCSDNTSTCGGNSDPCCTLEEAIRRSNGAGGTNAIEIHQFTGDKETVTGTTRKDGSAFGLFHTTTVYADSTAVVSVAVASGDSYKIDLGGSLQVGIVVRGTGSTLSGFTMDNKADNGDGTTWSGRSPYLYIVANNVVVDGMTILQPNLGAVLSNNVGIRFCSDDIATCNGGIIRNSTISGHFHTHVFMSGAMATCSDAGFAFYNDKFIFIRSDNTGSSATWMIFENSGCPITSGSPSNNIVLANIQLDYTLMTGNADPRGIYYRETTVPLFGFNIRSRGASLNRGFLYGQDNVEHSGNGTFQQEHVNIFYSTIVATGAAFLGDNGSTNWPMCFGSTSGAKGIHIVSNLFSGLNPVARLASSCGNAGNTFNVRSTNDTFNYNLCYASSAPDCVLVSSGAAITETGNLQTTTNPNVTNSGTATATTVPDTLRIDVGSNAIGACSNAPLIHLGQAAGSCSVSAAGITFDCTKDIDGQQRPTTGTTADCGADQFTAAAPAVTGSQRRRVVRFGP